jgi:hypothetical protein
MKDPNALKRGDPGYFDSIPDRGSRGGPGGGMGGFDCTYCAFHPPNASGCRTTVTNGHFPFITSASRPPREELPLPSRPPYTVFVGNLDFATTEEDMRDFFEGLEVSVWRCVWGFCGRFEAGYEGGVWCGLEGREERWAEWECRMLL